MRILHRGGAERDESGAILVWVALMAVVLLGVSALAVDLGYAYAVKRQLSSTADSAALAGAQEAGLKFSAPGVGGCTDTLKGYITTAVTANHVANNPTGTSASPEGIVIECADANGAPAVGTAATSVTVKVDETGTLESWFGRVFGITSLKPAATATARVFGSRYLSGLRPFLVCLDDAKTAREDFRAGKTPPTTFQSYYAKFDQSAPQSTTPAFNDATWDQSTDIITTGNQNHGLANGQYIRLEIVNGSVGAVSGYYYVRDSDKKDFRVSLSRGGAAVDIASNGTVDVFTITPAAGGGSQWNAATDVITDANHGLLNTTEVRVSVVSGSGGVGDGTYYVLNATTDTFQLSADKSTPLTITADMVIDVYPVKLADTGGSCNPATTPANWGYSAFDITNGDNQQLACLIEFGYGGGAKCLEQYPDPPGVDVGLELTGVPAEGDQGNNLGKADGQLIKDLIVKGEPILLPVGTSWSGGGGNNAQYDGRGALAVKLCAYVLPSNSDPSLANATDYYFDPGCGSATMYSDAAALGKVTKDTSLVIQWRYADWVFSFQGQPSGSTNQCPLDTCVGSLQLLK